MKSRHLFSFVAVYFMCALTSCASPTSGIMDAVNSSRVRICEPKIGPRLECRALTSDDLKLLGDQEIKPDAKKTVEAKGFSPGDECVIYGVNLKNEVNPLASFTCSKHEEVSFRLILSENNFMKGETMTLVAVNLKTNEKHALTIVPNAIQAAWDDGASISCTALDETMNVWYLAGRGFQPNERLDCTSKSWHEIINSERQVSGAGDFVSLQLPGVIGKTGGNNYITIERVDTGEKRMLTVPYGSFAFRRP